MTELIKIQEIVYTTINGLGLSCDVTIPETSAFPYIEIGEATAQTQPNQYTNIVDVIHEVNILGLDSGTGELLSISAKIIDAFDKYQNDDYNGYSVYFEKVESCQIYKVMIDDVLQRYLELKLHFVISKN